MPKIPMVEVPLVKDPELAAALEVMLSPYEGAQLLAAQDACRSIFNARPRIEGSFDQIVTAYQNAIAEATAEPERRPRRERAVTA